MHYRRASLAEAVCQEVPILEGPEFDVRLEHPDGGVLRELYHMGDDGGCSEVVWAPDGRFLAVLTSHVANISIIDVPWALRPPQVSNSHWFVREFQFSTESIRKNAARLTFTSTVEIEFELCEYSLPKTQADGGQIQCSQPACKQRMWIPSPLVAGAPP